MVVATSNAIRLTGEVKSPPEGTKLSIGARSQRLRWREPWRTSATKRPDCHMLAMRPRGGERKRHQAGYERELGSCVEGV